VIAGLAALLLVTAGASADDTHYRSIPIGAHAIALGGAFVGVADDASAAYFNPGGLVLGATRGLAGSLTINAWERVHVDQAFQEPDGFSDATTKRGRSVPVFIGAVVKFGPKDKLDRKKYALGISVLEPLFNSVGTFLEVEGDPVALTDTYRVDDSDRATWYGVSFASRLNLKQSIGASLYLSVRKLNHLETGLTLAGGMALPDDPNSFVGTSSQANTQSLGFRAFHFALRFGWLYRIKPQLQLGVMLQPPGIPLKQTVNTTSQGFINDNDAMPPTTRAFFTDGKVDANLPIPAQVDVGLEYWPAEKVMLAFDAAFYGPVRSGQRVKTSAPVQGLFFDPNTARRAIGNVAIAGDFYVAKTVMIETGFFTDLSSAKNIPANPDRFYNSQINNFGGTLSLGVRIAGVSLAAGATAIIGRGDATGVVVDVDSQLRGYTLTKATSRTFYLHITGATRAAADLGDKAQEVIKARREKKENGAEEPPATD
jgi:hypothetical protein